MFITFEIWIFIFKKCMDSLPGAFIHPPKPCTTQKKFFFLFLVLSHQRTQSNFYLSTTHINKHIYTQSVMAKNNGTLAILSENETLLSEKCSNCKCFGIHVIIVSVCTATTQKKLRRKVKLFKISHRTQKWTGKNYWHLVKIVRNNCFSSM